MTDREKYLLACNYAIMQLTRKGNCAVALDVNSDNPTIVYWNDVLEWLDKEYQEEQEQIKPEVEIDLYSVIKQTYIEREVLDKARTEIEHYAELGDVGFTRNLIPKDIVLGIIDKYKSEGQR